VLYRSPQYTIGQTGSDGGRQRYRDREGGRANAKGERRNAGSETDIQMKRERYTVLETYDYINIYNYAYIYICVYI